MIKQIILIFIIFLLCGCASNTSYVVYSRSPGEKTKKTVYTTYLEYKRIIIPNKLGIHAVVQEKQPTDIFYGLKQSLGILGSEDLQSRENAHLAIFLHNFTSNPIELDLALYFKRNLIVDNPTHVFIPSDEIIKLDIGKVVSVRSYGEHVYIDLSLKYENQIITEKLTLTRLTDADLNYSIEYWQDKKKNVVEFFENKKI